MWLLVSEVCREGSRGLFLRERVGLVAADPEFRQERLRSFVEEESLGTTAIALTTTSASGAIWH